MRTLSFVGALLAGAALVFGAAPADAQIKVGFIYPQKLLAEAPGVAEANKTLEDEAGRSRTEMQRLEDELKKLQGDFEKQQSTLSATVKQQRQQELQAKFTAYQQRGGELEQSLARRRAELLRPIEQRVMDAIESVRKEGGYAIIFDASAAVSADSTLDVTDRVLARLKAGGPTAAGNRPGK